MRMDALTVRGRMFDVCALVQCPDMLVMHTVRAGHGAVLLFVRGCRCEDRDRSLDVACTSVLDGSRAEHAACRSRAQCGVVQ